VEEEEEEEEVEDVEEGDRCEVEVDEAVDVGEDTEERLPTLPFSLVALSLFPVNDNFRRTKTGQR